MNPVFPPSINPPVATGFGLYPVLAIAALILLVMLGSK